MDEAHLAGFGGAERQSGRAARAGLCPAEAISRAAAAWSLHQVEQQELLEHACAELLGKNIVLGPAPEAHPEAPEAALPQ